MLYDFPVGDYNISLSARYVDTGYKYDECATGTQTRGCGRSDVVVSEMMMANDAENIAVLAANLR